MNIFQRINRHRLKKHFNMIGSKKLLHVMPCSLTFNDEILFITMFNREIKIVLKDIEEIRQGQRTDHWIEFRMKLQKKQYSTRFGLLRQILDDCESKSFSIILRQVDSILCRSYDFYTENLELFEQNIVCKLGMQIFEIKQAFKIENHHQMILEWIKDENYGNGTRLIRNNRHLTKLFTRILKRINLDLDRHYLDLIMSIDNKTYLDEATLLELVNKFDSRPYINFLFYKYSIDSSELMSLEGLEQFFLFEQNEKLIKEQLDKLMEEYGENSNCDQMKRFLTKNGFYRLIESNMFDLFEMKQREVCLDMSRPMTDYFIASSHNSYLSGNQFLSTSSYEMYRRILLSGCRCIEIDIWDENSKDGNETRPVVYHGYTMTTKIHLEGVLQTIQDVGFVRSDYPIIISVENRCKQEKNHRYIAEMMRKIFKDRLYIDPVSTDQFPSPEELRGKIFIKSYKDEPLHNHLMDFDSHITLGCWEIYYLSKEKKRRYLNSIKRIKLAEMDHNQTVITINKDIDENGEKYLNRFRPIIRFKHRSLVEENKVTLNNLNDNLSVHEDIHLSDNTNQWDESFSSLINYFQTRKFHSIEQCLDFEFYQMISRDERQSRELIEQSPNLYRQFTRYNMVRVYPAGWRQDSSNYCPIDHWNIGVQMVALNYQRFSMPMFLNNALFALNGGCGYVLKPSYLRNEHSTHQSPIRLRIQILCGQFWNHFARKKNELKITIRVYCASKKYQQSTQAVLNGFNPVWNETFEFKLDQSELTFIHFTLTNCDNFFGQYLISFAAIRKGLRHITFNDQKYQPIRFTRLFLYIEY